MKFLKTVCLVFLLSLLAGCGEEVPAPTTVATVPSTVETTEPTVAPFVDLAESVQPDPGAETAKLEVTVKTFVDGDTTHFFVPDSTMDTGVLKARYLAINTPESTGKIEEYGKAAAAFTREKLSQATAIMIESEDGNWNPDSTGGRYLVWVWYKTSQSGNWRNLNIEILQNGLAIANNAGGNRYGSVCLEAINQAKAHKLNLYSGQPDPDFFYGEAAELTLKELRTNIEQYNGMKVAFNDNITKSGSNTVYLEAYDAETDMYYGMTVYYGYGLPGAGLNILKVGNEARIVGTVQYYEAGGTWQVSGLTYRQMRPDDPENIQKLSEGHEGAFRLTTIDTFLNGTVEVEGEEGTVSYPYAQLALSTSVQMNDLQVISAYTTNDEESSSFGAITLTCMVDGQQITVRTGVMLDEAGNLVTQDIYEGQTIDVKGIVDFYDGMYQIKVFSAKDITIH